MNQVDVQKIIHQINTRVRQSLCGTLGSTGTAQKSIRDSVSATMENLMKQGAIGGYDVNINPITNEMSVKVKPVIAIKSIQCNFSLDDNEISYETAAIISGESK